MPIDHKEGKGSGGANCGHKEAGYMPGKGVYCPTCSSEHKEGLPFPDRNEVDEPKDFSPEGWEERYDKEICGHHIGIGNDSKIIREFIRSTLSLALKEERKRCVEMMREGIKSLKPVADIEIRDGKWLIELSEVEDIASRLEGEGE